MEDVSMSATTKLKDVVKGILPERIVWQIQSLLHEMATRKLRGLEFHLNHPDRLVLEDNIIPYFVAHSEFNKILFVGCEWFTKPYEKYFKNKEYWTIEIDPGKAKYGSRKHHIIDPLQNLSHHVEDNYFDLIFYNGVFGFGINTKEDTEESFWQCFQCLRPGGVLVFGWNDKPEYKPFPVIEECENLKRFQPYIFPPFAATEYTVEDDRFEYGHRFNFYTKPVTA